MDSKRYNRLVIAWVSLFALSMVFCVLAMWWPQLRNEFFVLMGNRNESGGYYGFWSGFAGATRTLEYFAIGLVIYWHRTCHYSPACLRWGKYPAAGGMFKLCHHHHPDLAGVRPGHDLIHRLHEERT